jgi:hypothetical protein
MPTCHICCSNSIFPLLDVGMIPISSRFVVNPEDDEYTHPFELVLCKNCGLVQVAKPVPAVELIPSFEWITYNEPETHLDQLADIIMSLPGMGQESVIGGVSYKDDSTLRRLKDRGINRTWRINPENDLGILNTNAGIETIQDRLQAECVDMLRQKYKSPNVVIVRHILEHAHHPMQFMEALHRLVDPSGYVVFEVPDCAQVMESLDYSTIWEEHVLYFSPESFRWCMGFGGFSVIRFECFPYPYENSLVAIAKPVRKGSFVSPSENCLVGERRRAEAFANGFVPRKSQIRAFLEDYRQAHGKIAIFGAGHLACMFVNLMECGQDIEFIVDDYPPKQGLLMPGSKLPIFSSDKLKEESIKLCLTSLSPESEKKVIDKNKGFLESGGVFASIFSTSEHALQITA